MIKSSKYKTQAIDSTPMAEIFLPLIITFLLLSTSNLVAKLDDATKAEIKNTGNTSSEIIDPWIISIEENTIDVDYIIEDKKLTLDELKSFIMEADPPPSKIGISATNDVPHGKVIELFLFCKKLSISAFEEIVNGK